MVGHSSLKVEALAGRGAAVVACDKGGEASPGRNRPLPSVPPSKRGSRGEATRVAYQTGRKGRPAVQGCSCAALPPALRSAWCRKRRCPLAHGKRDRGRDKANLRGFAVHPEHKRAQRAQERRGPAQSAPAKWFRRRPSQAGVTILWPKKVAERATFLQRRAQRRMLSSSPGKALARACTKLSSPRRVAGP
jgi:hypothetical protein